MALASRLLSAVAIPALCLGLGATILFPFIYGLFLAMKARDARRGATMVSLSVGVLLWPFVDLLAVALLTSPLGLPTNIGKLIGDAFTLAILLNPIGTLATAVACIATLREKEQRARFLISLALAGFILNLLYLLVFNAEGE